MEKYYDLSKMTPEEIAEDFLASEEAEKKAQEEAVEQTIAEAEAEGWECLGVFDGKEFFCSDKYDALKDEWLADLE